ncbi:MAG: hypothetical protein SNH73_07725 [Rikenellaceae bacterium]
MKKYLLFGFATLAMAVGCTEFRSEDPIAVDTTDVTPSISFEETTSVVDGEAVYSIEATITAAEGTSYYSYLVASGDAAELNATSLLKVSYSDLASATVSYDATPSTTIPVSASPNTTYTVYAVAANEQGQVGSIVTKTITTSNLDTPYPVSFDYDEAAGVMYVDFSEDVTVGASAAVTATVTAIYATATIDEITIAASDLSIVDGCTLAIALPELHPGANVALTWGEGVVENSASTPAPACADSSIAYQVTPVNFDLFVGVKNDDGSFQTSDDGSYVEQDGSTIYFSDNSDIVALFTDGTELAIYGDGGATCSIYDGSKTTSYTLSAGSDYGAASLTAIVAYFPEDLNYGATAAFSFAEGAFEDIYGNLSNAISTDDIYYRSRALSSADVVGTYMLYGNSYYYGATNESDYGAYVTISATTSRGTTTYTISGLCFGSTEELTMSFSEHSGSISIDDWQLIDYYNYGGTDYPIMIYNCDADAAIEFVYTDGVTFTSDTWWAYYIEGLGYYDVYMTSALIKVDAPAASAAVSSAGINLPRNYVERNDLPKPIR